MSNATENLRSQWLYRENPMMQVSAPRRTAHAGSVAVAEATEANVTSYITLSESFDISDALFIEYAQISLGVSAGAGSVGVLSGSLMVGSPSGSNRLAVGQMIGTGIYLPDVAAQDLAGFGANMILATPPTGILVLMSDLANFSPVAMAFPSTLELDIFLAVQNNSSNPTTVYYQSLFKWRHVTNVNDEG